MAEVVSGGEVSGGEALAGTAAGTGGGATVVRGQVGLWITLVSICGVSASEFGLLMGGRILKMPP